MKHKPVQQALQPHFKLDPRRLDFIARYITALLQVCTVNLNILGIALSSNRIQSNARRIKRFLNFDVPQALITQFVLSFMPDTKLVLTLDRTNWKFGQVTINFLVIGIAFKGIALPIAWVNLDKEGNSKTSERKSILERVLKLIPGERIDGFAADREFIGQEWFASLLEHGVNPVIRIKYNTLVSHRGKTAPAWVFFNNLRHNDVGQLTRAKVMGIRVFIVGTLTSDGDWLLIVTTKRPSQVLRIYAQRWNIETLFGAFKTRGFNLEDTHITDVKRSERLFALLVLTLVWAVRVGEFVSSLRPSEIKKHGYAQWSLFRRGLDCLRQILLVGCSDGLVMDDVVILLSSS
jgi:Transposase DDE domain